MILQLIKWAGIVHIWHFTFHFWLPPESQDFDIIWTALANLLAPSDHF